MQPNYLATQGDKDTMVAGLRVSRADFRDRGDARVTSSRSSCPDRRRQTDEDLLNHVRATAGTTFHQTSTCMMGPGPMAVVDTSLRVKGMERLRVIDASIMPTVVSGNTNATVHHDRREGRRHDPARGLSSLPRCAEGLNKLAIKRAGTWPAPFATWLRTVRQLPLPWFWFAGNSEMYRLCPVT